jgi:ADP-ribose pyrophosphatase YjhB (NUDIX family)
MPAIDSVAIMATRNDFKSGNDYVSLSCRLNTKTFPNVWAFAGGSIEVGETHQTAAYREFKEETGLEPLHRRFNFISYAFEGGQHCAVYHIELYNDEEPQHVETEKHTPWIWVNKNKIHSLIMMPGVERIINEIYIQ